MQDYSRRVPALPRSRLGNSRTSSATVESCERWAYAFPELLCISTKRRKIPNVYHHTSSTPHRQRYGIILTAVLIQCFNILSSLRVLSGGQVTQRHAWDIPCTLPVGWCCRTVDCVIGDIGPARCSSCLCAGELDDPKIVHCGMSKGNMSFVNKTEEGTDLLVRNSRLKMPRKIHQASSGARCAPYASITEWVTQPITRQHNVPSSSWSLSHPRIFRAPSLDDNAFSSKLHLPAPLPRTSSTTRDRRNYVNASQIFVQQPRARCAKLPHVGPTDG